jgi:hypothetical protein
VAVLFREELDRHKAHELAAAGFAAQTRGDGAAARLDIGEAVRLRHSAAYDCQEDRRHDAEEEHVTPAIATDQAVSLAVCRT